MPVIPATWEDEAVELLEPKRQRLQRVESVPLHSSLGEQDFISKRKPKGSYLLHTPFKEKMQGQVQWLRPVIPTLWEAKAGRSLEVRSSRSAWPIW